MVRLISAVSVLTLLFAISSALAQGTQADYSRARDWRHLVSEKVLHDELDARWLDGAIVYRKKVAGQPDRYIHVDADTGERRFASEQEWKRTRRQRRGRRKPAVNRRSAKSPDLKWIAEVRDHDVYLRATDDDNKTEHRLTNDGSADHPYTSRFYWSPDSSRLVVMRETVGDNRRVYLIESSPDDQVQPKLHHYDYLKPGDKVSYRKPAMFDIETRKPIAIDDTLFENPWKISDVRWRKDSSRFTFLFNERGHQTMRFVAVDHSGAATAIVEEKADTFIDYHYKTFVHHLDDTNEILWASERDGWNHLYLYDANTGEVKRQVTRGAWVVREVEHVDEQRREVWFEASGVHADQDPYHMHYCRASLDDGEVTVLTQGDGTHKVWLSPDRKLMLDTYSRVDLPPVHELRRMRDGELICEVERADISALRASPWVQPERFVAKGRDGETDIWGVILRPSNFDRSKKYPVIEHIYAGPHGAFTPKRFDPHLKMQELAELGFIVVQMDGMGTNHRGKKFHDVAWKNIGDAGFPDRIAWIKAAAVKEPAMDLSRVGIYGGSAGGQNAMRALIAHHDFYKVAVADCGCHDNRMDKIWWNEAWMGWPVDESYIKSSNVEQAHRMKGDLLLIVGELDRNVDPASTMQVVDALIKADKDFEMLVIPGAGHGAAETKYGTRRRRDFFVRKLLGVEPRR